MRPALVVGAATAAVLALTSCATVVRGSKETVRIDSEPSGAVIHLSNGLQGVTPATFELPRKASVIVEFQKDGYEPQSATLTPMQSKSGSIAGGGNALIGGAIGGAIDGSTGATLDLYPNPLVVKLRPVLVLPTAAHWTALKTGLTRRETRELLGEPSAVSNESGDQVWTYADGGSVQFHHFFVASWEAPPPAPTQSGDSSPAEKASGNSGS